MCNATPLEGRTPNTLLDGAGTCSFVPDQGALSLERGADEHLPHAPTHLPHHPLLNLSSLQHPSAPHLQDAAPAGLHGSAGDDDNAGQLVR